MIYNSKYGGFTLNSINVFKKSIKEIYKYKGYELGVEYYPNEIRHRSVLAARYGHIQGLKSQDSRALDCYIHPHSHL